jgi:hypothetical protein
VTPTPTPTATSTDTPTATATPACSAGDTGYLNATAQAADSGGDGNGFEVNPTYALTDGGFAAGNIDGPGDRHRFYNYGVSIPGGCAVVGIEARLDWWLDSTSGVNSMSVELSWNGGTSWTSAKTDSTETTTEHTGLLGGSTDTWGRSWTASELSNANFRVRVTSNSDNAFRDFYLEWVPVRVYYGSPPSYSYRRSIDITDAKVTGGPHPDFPLLVSISDPFLKTVANGGKIQNANGYDIIFTSDAAGTNKLDHEIELYDGSATGGKLVAWVRVPSLASSTVIYMFYGSSGVSSSQENVTGVWDSSFKGVWHLKQDPSGTPPQMIDSTSNPNDGSSGGGMLTGDLVDAQIGKGLDFDGTGDYIDVGNDTSLQVTEVTIEAWVKPAAISQYYGIAGKLYDGVAAGDYKGFALVRHDTNRYRFYTANGGPVETTTESNSTYTDTNWHHIVGVRRSGTNYLYVDGVEQTATGTVAIADSGGYAFIGRQYHNYDGRYFYGIIDEVRISSTGRSAGWIATEYSNQFDPSGFYTVGPEQPAP